MESVIVLQCTFGRWPWGETQDMDVCVFLGSNDSGVAGTAMDMIRHPWYLRVGPVQIPRAAG